jgi:NitT/TauT family transport system ATP-binding protein
MMCADLDSWLALRDFAFGYGRKPVLSRLNLGVPDTAPVLAVVGPSGVGKSTLIGLLAGHLKPSMGTLIVCGEVVTDSSSARPVVFQDHNLFPWMTVLENVAFGLKCQGIGREERDRQGRALLALMGLQDSEGLYPAALSGGMSQRVGLARALAVGPRCILLDEPFHALDPHTRGTLRDELIRLVTRRSMRAVIVTHDVEDAVRMAGMVLVLRDVLTHAILDLSHHPLPRAPSWADSAEERKAVSASFSNAFIGSSTG